MHTNIFQIISLLLLSLLLQSCTGRQKLWVSGVKTDCSTGAGKTKCLLVSKNENLQNATWENFYAPIEGFNYEEGVFKKIQVKVQQTDKENVPADASSIKYKLVKELERIPAPRAALSGKWTLTKLNNAPISRAVPLPTLEIDLAQKQFSGSGGCNRYSAQIKHMSTNAIELSPIVSTKMACINKNIESEYFGQLAEAITFAVADKKLIFYDKDSKEILLFIHTE
ncbi:MAG: DUF4377 domain-containing protein [Saprospiraceae bacterium]|nr:DUF4377 domain-containing protein [Saprospiraceae bacterium]MBP7699384.1 DUF4377 domain-containing protein [Saprospiraceae bacterium]